MHITQKALTNSHVALISRIAVPEQNYHSQHVTSVNQIQSKIHLEELRMSGSMCTTRKSLRRANDGHVNAIFSGKGTLEHVV